MDSIRRYLHFVKPYRLQIIATIIIGIIKFAIPLLIPLLIKYVWMILLEMIACQRLIKWINFFHNHVLCSSFLLSYVHQLSIIANILLNGLPVKSYMISVISYLHISKNLSFKFYSNTKTGEVISRIINDVEQTKTFVVTGLMNIWLDLVTIIIAIAIMFTMDVKLTLVSILLLPFYAISVKYFFGKLRILTRKRSQALAEVQGYLT